MALDFRVDAPKKAVNLTLNGELVDLGRRLGLNLSKVAEAAVAQAVKEALEAQWLQENAVAIEAFNAHVEAHGVFSDGYRTF